MKLVPFTAQMQSELKLLSIGCQKLRSSDNLCSFSVIRTVVVMVTDKIPLVLSYL